MIRLTLLLIIVLNFSIYGVDTTPFEEKSYDTTILLVIVNSLIIYIIAKKQNRRVLLHILIGFFLSIIWPVVMLFLGKSKNNIICTWCDSTKMKFLEGTEGKWYWEYRNKNGSQDKRVKDNYQSASYISIWQCKKCNAKSKFIHYVSKKPSKSVNVSSGELFEEGKGERIAENFYNDGTTVHINKENRKGN